MKNYKYSILITILIVVLISSCNFGYVRLDDLSFGGITLYPNKTYDLIYSEHDVGGVLLNLGEYRYIGDTLVLNINDEKYLDELTRPILTECSDEIVTINFKEYLSSYWERSSMMSNWFHLKIKGMTEKNDTLDIWSTNSLGRETNFHQIEISKHKLRNVRKVWVEIYDMPTTNPITLPESFECIDITIPIINEVSAQVSDKHIMWRMDRFLIKERRRRYVVEVIGRKHKFKIRK